ncbi:MAG: class I SAM-dependent rRNA methyltransferase [Alphaproteobacteria bacterium]
MAEQQTRPTVRILPRRHQRVKAGHPWVYSNEIEMTPAVKALPPGTVVDVANAGGEPLGSAMVNPHSLVALRVIDAAPGARLDRGLIAPRLAAARDLRDRLVGGACYRLVHAEADRLPGLIVDRFDDVVVVQANTAGMQAAEAEVLAALRDVLAPRSIVLRNDSPARAAEGLDLHTRVDGAPPDLPLAFVENGVRFLADPSEGQKTGWFHDQRDNRRAVAELARGARVLDVFAYTGGFGVTAACAGAAEVVMIDRSEPALALAERAAALNDVADRCRFVRAAAFAELETLGGGGARFDVVVVDPPAFVKSRRDLAAGSRGYTKLTRLAAPLVSPGGFLLVASCSHNVAPDLFADLVRKGLEAAGRNGRILRSAGAAPDHPVHPFLPESAYLKVQLLQLD